MVTDGTSKLTLKLIASVVEYFDPISGIILSLSRTILFWHTFSFLSAKLYIPVKICYLPLSQASTCAISTKLSKSPGSRL